MAPRSPRDAEDARAVLSGRAISIPTFIAAMPGAVRGGGSGSAHPLRAVEPFRSAVLEARPRFSWTPVRDAQSYRVAVFDADYEEVAHSEALNGTSWRPSKPLPAGVDLSWHVVADTAAGEMSSAGSDRAEAVFRVLAPKEASEVDLGVAQYPDSHLLRGLLYRRHGLLDDAEREFRSLAEQNPDSPIARQADRVRLPMRLIAAALLLLLPGVVTAQESPADLVTAGKALYKARKYKDAQAAYEKARAGAEAAGDSITAARAKLGLASLKTLYGAFDEGITLATEARATFEAAGDRHAAAMALHSLGNLHIGAAKFAEAAGYFRQCVAISDGRPEGPLPREPRRMPGVARAVSPVPRHVARGHRSRDRLQ